MFLVSNGSIWVSNSFDDLQKFDYLASRVPWFPNTRNYLRRHNLGGYLSVFLTVKYISNPWDSPLIITTTTIFLFAHKRIKWTSVFFFDHKIRRTNLNPKTVQYFAAKLRPNLSSDGQFPNKITHRGSGHSTFELIDSSHWELIEMVFWNKIMIRAFTNF